MISVAIINCAPATRTNLKHAFQRTNWYVVINYTMSFVLASGRQRRPFQLADSAILLSNFNFSMCSAAENLAQFNLLYANKLFQYSRKFLICFGCNIQIFVYWRNGNVQSWNLKIGMHAAIISGFLKLPLTLLQN